MSAPNKQGWIKKRAELYRKRGLSASEAWQAATMDFSDMTRELPTRKKSAAPKPPSPKEMRQRIRAFMNGGMSFSEARKAAADPSKAAPKKRQSAVSRVRAQGSGRMARSTAGGMAAAFAGADEELPKGGLMQTAGGKVRSVDEYLHNAARDRARAKAARTGRPALVRNALSIGERMADIDAHPAWTRKPGALEQMMPSRADRLRMQDTYAPKQDVSRSAMRRVFHKRLRSDGVSRSEQRRLMRGLSKGTVNVDWQELGFAAGTAMPKR